MLYSLNQFIYTFIDLTTSKQKGYVLAYTRVWNNYTNAKHVMPPKYDFGFVYANYVLKIVKNVKLLS